MTSTKSMLDGKEHARLRADLPHICATANLPERYLHISMRGICGEQEVDWVRNFNPYRKDYAGLVLVGGGSPDTRCMAICAALVRNFVDARMITVDMLLLARDSGVPSPTVLVIPNLFLATKGMALPPWQIRGLHDILLTRAGESKPTVAFVQELEGVKRLYGDVFHDHLTTRYMCVGAGDSLLHSIAGGAGNGL